MILEKEVKRVLRAVRRTTYTKGGRKLPKVREALSSRGSRIPQFKNLVTRHRLLIMLGIVKASGRLLQSFRGEGWLAYE
jgi:hypothetical protein